jgi:2-haloacid dehalogenase
MAKASGHFVFDAFGTLFDVHSATREHASAIGPAWTRLSEIWRAKQLEYTWIRAGIGDHYIPFREVTLQALHYALSVCGVDEAFAPRLLETYQRLQAYPEVPEVLHHLKSTGAKLAILSNGDTDMLDDIVENAGLKGLFDALISVRVAGTFKPVRQVYGLATEVFGVSPGEITFLSSNRWDIAGATAFGFETIWVNRTGAPDEYRDLPASRTVANLSPLADFSGK